MQHDELPITVLMAAYNAEKYLDEAISSILSQTFTEFEFLIINDGSTDGTDKIIASYQDSRIRCITNENNLNLCQSLAKGVSLSRGKFIARMDADDIAHPMRLAKQLAVMISQPDLDLLGTNVQCIDQSGKIIGRPKVISDPVDLRWNILFRNCFNHPTVMIRKSALQQRGLNYGVIPDAAEDCLPENLSGIGDEDYMLFGLLSLYGRVGNLDEVLLDYRIHKKSLTAVFSEKQSEQTRRISNALQTIYVQHGIDQDSTHNPQHNGPTTELKGIAAIALRMIDEFSDPSARQRIMMLSRLQFAISRQKEQAFWKRFVIGISFVCKLALLKQADFLAVLKYVFGTKSVNFYKRYLQLHGR